MKDKKMSEYETKFKIHGEFSLATDRIEVITEIVSELWSAMAIQTGIADRYVKSAFSRRELVVTTLGQDIETSSKKLKKVFQSYLKSNNFQFRLD